MFYKWTNRLVKGLKKIKVSPTYTNTWVAHNMGLGGAEQIIKYVKTGDSYISQKVIRNMKNNMPYQLNTFTGKKEKIEYDSPMDYYFGWEALINKQLK
jgi:hypothetical protein